jgi:hypothetical protein
MRAKAARIPLPCNMKGPPTQFQIIQHGQNVSIEGQIGIEPWIKCDAISEGRR